MYYTAFIDNIAESLHNIGFNVSQFALSWIIPVAFIIVIFFIWIILRKIRLWYWKIDLQLDTLNSINQRLIAVEGELKNLPDLIQDKLDLDEITQDKINEKEEPEMENIEAEAEFPILQEGLEPIADNGKSREVDFFYTGKSGRVYTEEELLLQIRE
jgi:hypothetical protein